MPLSDFRYALRQLRRAPGFALVAVLSLGLGIGANATIFSVASALLIRPLPVAHAERLARVYRNAHSPLGYAEYAWYRDRARSTDAVIAERLLAVGMGTTDVERVGAALVSGNYFDALGERAVLGRAFALQDEDASGASAVVVLAHDYWERRFGGNPAVVGSAIVLNGHPFTVVGVARDGFRSSQLGWHPAMWIPLGATAALTGTPVQRWGGSLYTTARLREGVSRGQAEAEYRVLLRRLAATDSAAYARATVRLDHARGLTAELRGPTEVMSGFLLVIVGLVLAIACANLANRLLARGVEREREIGVRIALGASRGRLVRQLLVESLLLALAGGAVGLGASVWTTALLERFVPESAEVALDFAPDWRVLAFTLAASVATGVLFGLVPALRSTAPDVQAMLKDAGHARGAGRSRLRSALVVVQVTLCTVLVGGASFFLHSLANATVIDPGFSTRGIYDAAIDLSPAQLDSAASATFWRRLLEEARALPGVRSATLAELVPLAGSNMERPVWLPAQGGEAPRRMTYFNVVDSAYFATLGIPLAQGEGFTARPGRVVVNETMARTLWPGRPAIGQRLGLEGPDGPWLEVAGVARDTRYNSLGEHTPSFLYLNVADRPRTELVLQLRADGDVRALHDRVSSLVHALEPRVPAGDLRPIGDDLAVSLIPARAGAALLGTFGALALVLAMLGIYGVTSYVVARRTREFGIRGALGATPRMLLRLAAVGSTRLVLAGLAIGLLLTLGLGRLIATQLYGVGAADPAALLGTVAVLALTAGLATLVPARRAARANPVVALRAE